MKPLDKLEFSNTFSSLPESFYTRLDATPLENPKSVCFSHGAGKLLDLEDSETNREQLTQICSGNSPWPGSTPVAMIYSGHQFGEYNPQLGDGRGLLLGEVINSQNEKWDLHLKGAGQTPYSRFGDGRAVLRSCIREFLGSEALHHLGIPTTRALCVTTSDTPVYREKTEKGSTLLRLAKSHIRFGHFEYFFYSKKYQLLNTLLEYTLEQSFPQFAVEPDGCLLMFQEVIQRTARMIAQWQAVGFAHGVMNTDNMSIIADTFDYGPFGFIDDFDWNYICNHSDYQGRYAFNQQPAIGYWNCGRLGQALTPLVDKMDSLQTALDAYPDLYTTTYLELMKQKLGLVTEESEDEDLIKDLLKHLHKSRCDYTSFFRQLCDFRASEDNPELKQFIQNPDLIQWLDLYSARLKRNLMPDDQRSQKMKQQNPKYILRNYLAQIAIDKAEEGDYQEIDRLMHVLTSPFEEHPEFDDYAKLPPDWGKKLEISCSS